MGSNPTADIVTASGKEQKYAGDVTGEGDVGCHDSLAERSKAVAQGAIPKWAWVRTPQLSMLSQRAHCRGHLYGACGAGSKM